MSARDGDDPDRPLNSVLLFGAAIGLVAVAWRYLNVDATAAFWVAYALTRPLGASLGDLLSQARADGGLGLGSTTTSYVFLGAIAAVVVVLTRAHRAELGPAGTVEEAPSVA